MARWSNYFIPAIIVMEGLLIVGKTAIGQATVRLLKLNAPMRLAEREALRSIL